MSAHRFAGRLLVAAFIALAGCEKKPDVVPGAPPKVINFSILAVENSNTLNVFWQPIIADMEKQVGIPVKPFYGSNYTILVEAMRFGQTDAGWFSNMTGVEAVRRAGGEVFARTIDSQGDDGYKSVLIVPASSATTLEDVLKCDKSLNFGIGDPLSTSGTLAPMTYLFTPQGIRPSDCFKTVRSAQHGPNLLAVSKGVLDVATGNSTNLRLQLIRGPEGVALARSVRVIWESPRLPEDPIIWRKTLDPVVKEKLRRFFLTYGQGNGPEAERQRKLLASISIGGFRPADNNHLLPAREMEAMEALQLARRGGNQAKIAAAQKAFDTVRTERAVVEARTGQPAS